MAEITVSTDIEVKCECGQPIDASMQRHRDGSLYLECAPCKHCLSEEKANGNGEGYSERDAEVAALEQQVLELIEQLPPPPLPASAGERPPRRIQH